MAEPFFSDFAHSAWQDVERLAEVGDLVVGCASAEELLRRGSGLLNGGG